ncbi:MAG: hotdog fold thioesterase [Flavobacteriales bacterium]|jgi:acyl-CoA thioesterase|nr:hotdog fold thioesterase [Flavobacteriales bacterium]
MTPEERAIAIVDRMYDGDAFSRWLGIERLVVAPGHCVLRMVVRPEMLNGFAIAHGGIAYALADSCLAFAANSHGEQCVSIETSISHTRRAQAGDVLTATSEEMVLGRRTAIYGVRVTDRHGEAVALFKGTVFRTGKEW